MEKKKRLGIYQGCLISLFLSGCVTPQIKIPAQNLKTQAYSISIPCKQALRGKVFIYRYPLKISKTGFSSGGITELKCPVGQKGFVLFGFDVDGFSALDAHFQYLYER